VDENDPEKGLVFDGRVTEDFKLDSGTWVSVGTLRAQAVGAVSPLIQDCVVCGQDKPFVALLAWPNIGAAKEIAGDPSLSGPAAIVAHPKVRAFVQEKFAEYNKANPGSSSRVKRVILMTEPPSIDGNEITDKGYVNQRATMDRRHELVDRLFVAQAAPDVIEIP
jgi:feruloyl-CoA synthase